MHTGGWADKLGNRYEGRWAAKQLLRLLDGKRSAVRLESFSEDHVDLFVTNLDGTIEFHQCKRTIAGTGWTIRQLEQRGVLAPLRTHLGTNKQYRFVFVSNQQAVLARIADLSRQFQDYSGFISAVETVAKDKALWSKWCTAIQCSNDLQMAFDLLRRAEVVLFGDSPREMQDLYDLANFILLGDPHDVVLRLVEYATDHMGQWIHADVLRRFIEKETSFEFRQLAHSEAVPPAIERCRDEYRQSIAPYLVSGALIPRPEAQALLQSITSGSKRLHVLHGASGQGKSCILYELMSLLEGTEIPFFIVRFDTHVPRANAREFGKSLGLPESPVLCLHAIAVNRPSVMILDQLDALHWSLRHDPTSWAVFLQLMNDLFQTQVTVHAVVACRTFDLQNDANIKAWRHDKDRGPLIEEIAIADLPEASVMAIVERRGPTWSSLSNGQRALLRKPLHLYMWCQLVDGSSQALAFRTSTDLLRQFWNDIRGKLVKKGCAAADVKTAIEQLVSRMDRDGKLTAPESTMEHWPSVRDGLLSLDVLHRADSKIRFVHQSYLDFILASIWRDRLRDEGKTIFDWLNTDDEQSLLRRGQLRQLLVLMRDDEPVVYLDSIRAILRTSAVRFHLQHLTLQFLGSIAEPSTEEAALVAEFLHDPCRRDTVISQVIVLRPQWFRAIDTTGLWQEWLSGSELWQPEAACWVLRTVVDAEEDRVLDLLDPYVGNPDPWRTQVWSVLPYSPENDSARTFAWRLRLVREGVSRRLDFLFNEEFAKRFPRRVIELLAEIIRSAPRISEEGEQDMRPNGWPHWLSRHTADVVLLAAEQEPIFTWETLLPILLNAVDSHPVQMHRWDEQSFQPDALWNDRVHDFDRNGAEPLPAVLASAGGHWLQVAFADASEALHSLYSCKSRTVQQVIGTAWLRGPGEAADEALTWLAVDEGRFDLGEIGRNRKRTLAKQLIARFAPLCSPEVYDRLETAILAHYPPEAIEDYKFRIKTYLSGERWYSANDYDFSQYALLSSLPPKRQSSIVVNTLGQLREKYVRSPEDIEGDHDPKGGFVSSPISSHGARLSDKAWLELLTRGRQTKGQRRRSFRTLLESSPEMFARDLASEAERDPGRFASLALRAPRGILPVYWSGLLRALGLVMPAHEKLGNWEPATDELCKAVLERVGYDLDREIGVAFCRCIAERPECGTGPVILQALCRYAMEHPDPDHDGCVLPADSEDRLETEAINTVRALAAAGIAAILYANPAFVTEVLPAISTLATDNVACVRTAAIRAIVPILNSDRDLAVNLFLEAVRGTNEEVVRTVQARTFLGYVIKSHLIRVQPLVDRMAMSTSNSVAKDGAAWATVIRLLTGEPSQVFQQCAAGSPSQRAGVAETLAQHLDYDDFAPACRKLLPQFFDDDEPSVRKAASTVLHKEADWSKKENACVLARYFLSKTFVDEISFSLRTLEDFKGSLTVLSEAIFAACDTCSKVASRGASYTGPNLDPAFGTLSGLLLRLYGHTDHGDRDVRKKCLDRWDAILQKARWVSADMLQSLDT